MHPRRANENPSLSEREVDPGIRAGPQPLPQLVAPCPPVEHANIRGADYYGDDAKPATGGGRMLNQQTMEKLHALHLNGMADAIASKWKMPDGRA